MSTDDQTPITVPESVRQAAEHAIKLTMAVIDGNTDGDDKPQAQYYRHYATDVLDAVAPILAAHFAAEFDKRVPELIEYGAKVEAERDALAAQIEAALYNGLSLGTGHAAGCERNEHNDESDCDCYLSILSASPSSVLSALKADIWDEGHSAGRDDFLGNDGSWPTTPNPYRMEAQS